MVPKKDEKMMVKLIKEEMTSVAQSDYHSFSTPLTVDVIALIDDDRNILTSLSIALEKEGFKVQTYIDGESALIGLTRMPPDLAVVDIKMPKMDGEELLKKLRKKTSLPVIFLTSKDDEIDELLGLKLGAIIANKDLITVL